MTLNRPTFVSEDIINAAITLFASSYDFSKPIRSLSVKVSGISCASCAVQTDMFLTESQRERKERLEFVIDALRNRFGHFSLTRCVEQLDPKLTAFNPKGENTIHPYSYL